MSQGQMSEQQQWEQDVGYVPNEAAHDLDQVIERTEFEKKFSGIKEVWEHYNQDSGPDTNPFTRAVRLAEAMQALWRMVTPDVVKMIRQFEGSNLGYKVDRPNKKAPPYTDEEIKSAFVEAILYGASPIGNEWNVISGSCYLTKYYYRRRCKTFEGVTDLDFNIGLPKLFNGMAIVAAEVHWIQKEQPQCVKREFNVRLNYGMGADGAIGKTERKIGKVAYEKMQGVSGIHIIDTPDGDLEETGDHAPEGLPQQSPSQLQQRRGPTMNDIAGEAAQAPPKEEVPEAQSTQGRPPQESQEALEQGESDASAKYDPANPGAFVRKKHMAGEDGKPICGIARFKKVNLLTEADKVTCTNCRKKLNAVKEEPKEPEQQKAEAKQEEPAPNGESDTTIWRQVLKLFSEAGVTEEQLVKHVGKEPSKWEADDIEDLRRRYKAAKRVSDRMNMNLSDVLPSEFSGAAQPAQQGEMPF